MQEILEQFLDYLKGIWLKRRYIIVSTWLICPIAWIYISQMDNVYKSEARVYADTQSLLRPLLRGLTVETNPDYQISLMVRTLLSRPNVERITRMTDLDIQAETSESYEKLIEGLKNNIKIQSTGRGRENIFVISYEHKNPEMAKNVVQSALTVFIENTLGENRSDSDSAQKFLSEQIKDLENRLLTAEAKLTSFKQKYSSILVNNQGGYYKALNADKIRLKQAELELSEAVTRLNSAKAQLASAAPNIDSLSSSKVQTEGSLTTTFDSRIAQLESQLDSLLLRYTDRHPDVIELQNRLTQLNSKRENEIKKYYSSSDSNSSSISSIEQNPVFQELKIQVNQYENEVASLTVRVNNYKSSLVDLESKIHTLPEIEAELISLTRGYDITKKQHAQLLQRQETAQLAQQADDSTSKINFKIIDPPRAPTEPTGPKRILFLIIATILGAGVGIGLSLLFSQINPVVTSRNQVTKATGIPVFGVVSATENLGLQQWHKKKTIIFIISNTLLLGLLMCFILYSMFPEQILAPLKGVL
ncbi:XrtA system polysaccharide chain length determinant [Colwelliaceae bacterium 6441]